MAVLRTELVHDPLLDFDGPRLERAAVRGVLRRGSELLLIQSHDGDYGFPGGGVAPGETPEQALAREMLEEAGLPEVAVGDELLSIVEHRPAREPDIAVFTMVSRYFVCASEHQPGALQLEAYEVDLGLRPVWVAPEVALQTNEEIQAARPVMHWVVRETMALRLIMAGEV